MSQPASTGAYAGNPVGDVVLRARGLDHRFGQTHALRGIDLDVVAGEVLAIMGPSGSGKSTLLHILAGVFTPDAGTVDYEGRSISSLDESSRSRLRLAEFGFVFQFGQLLPDLSAIDNVSIPLLLAGMPRREALQRSEEQLQALGLADDQLQKLPGEMSGGQAQRVAVARALVRRPSILFTDEPTGSLDSLSAEQTMRVLTKSARAAGASVVVITHDPLTAAYADREVTVRDGRISAGTAVIEDAR